MYEEVFAATTSQDPRISKTKDVKYAFVDALIREVKKRPFLWDRKHSDYGCRSKVNRCWIIIGAKLKKRPEEAKTKWRNLKDSFFRLEKRLQVSPEDEESSVSCYAGQWIHFEKLLFLRESRLRHLEDSVEVDVPEVFIEDIKGEIDTVSEHSNISDDNTEKAESEHLYTEPLITLQNVLGGSDMTVASNERKRPLDCSVEGVECKRKMGDIAPKEEVIDEDLHFVKSLVPFLRKLNPIRKLIVRNEMQNLLIKEMLCDRCRNFGSQLQCRCNS